jgi:hypothetical protein
MLLLLEFILLLFILIKDLLMGLLSYKLYIDILPVSLI